MEFVEFIRACIWTCCGFFPNVRALNPPGIHIAEEVRTALLDFDAVIELEPEKGRLTTHFFLFEL